MIKLKSRFFNNERLKKEILEGNIKENVLENEENKIHINSLKQTEDIIIAIIELDDKITELIKWIEPRINNFNKRL